MQSPMNQSEKLEVGKEYPGTDYCRMTESEGQRSTGRGPCAKWGESDRSCMCVDHRVPPCRPPCSVVSNRDGLGSEDGQQHVCVFVPLLALMSALCDTALLL